MATMNSLRQHRPLSDDDLRRHVPSLFATDPSERVSGRYAHIPTFQVVDGLRREGFVPVFATQSRTRDPARKDFTKHMVRFRHEGRQAVGLNEIFPEVVLVNSHDGSSSYQISSGVFRLVCLNGMTVAETDGESLRVRHQGDVVGKVIEGSYKVLGDAQETLRRVEGWQGVALGRPMQEAMAEAAAVIRFGDADGNMPVEVRPDDMLRPRRAEDRKDDLWTTFNRLQEASIRGGVPLRNPEDGTRRRSREITGIDQDQKVNKALWLLGERMAAILGR